MDLTGVHPSPAGQGPPHSCLQLVGWLGGGLVTLLGPHGLVESTNSFQQLFLNKSENTLLDTVKQKGTDKIFVSSI